MFEMTKWDSFYVIVGSAGGALIGLQFVVMTLIAARPPVRAAQVGAVYSTPTIVHFSVVVLVSALLRAPWDSLSLATVLCGFIGAVAVVYILVTGRRMWIQTAYKPDFEDWLFHLVLPLAAYTTLVASPLAAHVQARPALFAVGAAVLVLLFTGIHNAWDAVSYFVLAVQPKETDRANQ